MIFSVFLPEGQRLNSYIQRFFTEVFFALQISIVAESCMK